MKAFQKYLNTYGERAAQEPNLPPYARTYSVCIIPLYDESIESIQSFLNYSFSRHVTYVLVFNCPVGGDKGAIERTQKTVTELKERYVFESAGANCYVTDCSSLCRCYIFDFSNLEDHFPDKKGVGLARKIGMDFAIQLCLEQASQGDDMPKWLHSCDGDVDLPEGYFDISDPSPGQSAAIYAFEHVPEAGCEQAVDLYEFRLRYYVEKLKMAGSPYAFHTIGSTICATPLAYVQVRGIPKRSGGEDFYFLNKLAKIGCVEELNQPTLRISGRPSQRVPFGTGPAIREITDMESPKLTYRYYHPKIFQRLNELLLCVSQNQFLTVDEFEECLKKKCAPLHHEQILYVLRELKLQIFFNHLQTQNISSNIDKEFHSWFDAFLTLRFVHLMRDLYYPNLSLDEITDFTE